MNEANAIGQGMLMLVRLFITNMNMQMLMVFSGVMVVSMGMYNHFF